MEWSFEIVRVHRYHNRGDFIFARLMEGDPDFQVKRGAVLGGVPICHYIEMTRKLDEKCRFVCYRMTFFSYDNDFFVIIISLYRERLRHIIGCWINNSKLG